jgi:hypothetical protein
MMRGNKKAQVTIFIILAVLVVVSAGVYFFVWGNLGNDEVPTEVKPVYDYYVSCIDELTKQGISLLGQQGGYIYVDDLKFEAGSYFMPFSSQLNFLGQPIPYWFYISGNNVLGQQVPTIPNMEDELAAYISDNLEDCNFDSFYSQGYDVVREEGDVAVEINDANVNVAVGGRMKFYFGDAVGSVSRTEVSVSSALGRNYELASEIYNQESTDLFLESYALDTIYNYAPVSGVELGCSPLMFNKESIREDVLDAIQTNIASLKVRGDYYSNADDYFVVDVGESVDAQVNFLYSRNFPTKIEIFGEDFVEPVGLQEGLSALGFCYSPYHFVYDLGFPVLVQIYDGNELFQFPVVVLIDNNQIRENLLGEGGEVFDNDVCALANQDIQIYTYDLDLNPVEANIHFSCMNSGCAIGSTKIENGEAVLRTKVAQCLNGLMEASADGYVSKGYTVSTNQEDYANILMKKLYDIPLDLGSLSGQAVVNFVSEDYSTSLVYPDQKVVSLADGYYNVSVMVYSEENIHIPANNERVCIDVPASGLGAFVGLEEEKCFDVETPEQDSLPILIGGGNTREYVSESSLREAQKLNIRVPLFEKPSSFEDAQNNLVKLEDSLVYVDFIV